MTLKKRLRVGVLSLVAAASVASAAAAGSPKALSDSDARAYAAAFAAVDQGDFVGAQLHAAETQDRSLDGYIAFRALMHPTAHKATFDELAGWLAKFRDLPLADRVFALAAKRKPADAAPLPTPEVALVDTARSEITWPARDAFYSGDARTAFRLAVEVGERWIAGLSAWRLGDYAQAHDYFALVAQDSEEDVWQRSAAAYWAARSAVALGDVSTAQAFLQLAAQAPQTFYGMLAERQVRMTQAAAPTGRITLASYRAPARPAAAVLDGEPRAHRAAALVQIGRLEEARAELRAGLALARSPEERQAWSERLTQLYPLAGSSLQRAQYLTLGDYETPDLKPQNGFTVDKALVYAIVRQESRFNPRAVSHAGARGLMQVMPASATHVTGDRRYVRKPRLLHNPAVNLRVGQDYLGYLMDRGVGPDLLKVVAAYNAGPGAVLSTVQKVGDHDPLLMIESLPALETRNYVEKVVAAYWSYKRIFGEEPRTLDALASGERHIDARLDSADAPRSEPQVAPQPLQIGAAATFQATAFD
ncbi:MAG: lytic transglycosylase domain-containing protein [Pseudomonadota bacterium]